MPARKKTKKKTKTTAKKKTAKKTAKKAAKKAPAKKKAVRKAAAKKTTRASKPRAKPAGGGWALALSGSGSRSAFLVGALEQLKEAGHAFPIVSGSGAGALLAAIVAQGKWHGLKELANSIEEKKLLKPRYKWWPKEGANFLLASIMNTESLYLADEGLNRLVNEWVDASALVASETETLFVARDMQTGKTRYFSNREDTEEDLIRGLVASASEPVLMPLVKAGEERHQYTGTALNPAATLNALFRALRRDGAPRVERVVALSSGAPAEGGPYRDVGSILRRTLELAGDPGPGGPLRATRLINALAALRDEMGERSFARALNRLDDETRAEVEHHAGKRHVPLYHLHPNGALDAMDPQSFGPGDLANALEAGAKAARMLTPTLRLRRARPST